jgi:hypothetical protein
VRKVFEHRERLINDVVGGATVHVSDQADATGIVLEAGVVETTGDRGAVG